MKVILEETKPPYPNRIRMAEMKDEQKAQGMPPLMPPIPFRARQRSNWDMVTPSTSDAPPPPLRSPPFRMRPRPKPEDIVDCLPNDLERLSLPVLTTHDLTNDPSKSPPLPLNIIKRRRPSAEECSQSVCGKRTRETADAVFCKSATFQYPGISGRTIYADPITGATEFNDDDIITTCSEKKSQQIEEEDFYFPMPRFTKATRSALPHVLQLSK